MNGKCFLLLATVAATVAASCAKEAAAPQNEGRELIPMSFSVRSDDARAALDGDGSTINWVSGDKINVFSNGTSYTFTTTESGKNATFTGSAAVSDDGKYYALYPYSASAEISSSADILVTYPMDQTAPAGSFDPAAHFSAGVTEVSGEFSMKNADGLVSVTFAADTDIEKIVLVGRNQEWVSGIAKIDFGSDGIPTSLYYKDPAVASTPEGHRSYRLALTPEEGTFKAGTYYMCLPVMRFTKGISLRFYRNDGKYAEKLGDSILDVVRSGITPLGTINPASLDWEDAPLEIAFTKGCRYYNWPFTQNTNTMPTSYNAEKTTTAYTNLTGAGSWTAGTDVFEYTLSGSGLPFRILASNAIARHGYLGVRFGGASGDYMEVPAQAGKRIYKIRIQATPNMSGAIGSPAIYTTGGTLVTGGEAWTGTVFNGEEHTWYLSGTAENTPYRIQMTADGTLCMGRIEVWYTTADETGVYNAARVTTIDARDNDLTTGTTALMSGSFIPSEGFDATQYSCGFEYKAAGDGDWTSVSCDSPAINFSKAVTGLTKDTDYSYRAWAKGSGAKVYGPTRSFHTFIPDGESAFTFKINLAPGTPSGSAIDDLPSNRASVEGATCNGGTILYHNLGTPYTFQLWATYGISKSTSSGNINGLRYNTCDTSNDPPTYGGKDGIGWLRTAVVPGKRLAKVVFTVGGNKSRWNISNQVPYEGTGDYRQYAATTVSKGAEKTWELANPELDTPYYLAFYATSGTSYYGYNLTVSKLEFYYTY
ncbi:MAG: hypothetical protein IJV01_00180 [Bacteroidales bacterium]|nr:hypothetical protein [Bacteroidales bacterium]